MKIIYETERLIVRQWEEKDCEDLFEMLGDADVVQFLTFPAYQSLEEAKENIAKIRQKYEAGLVTADYCMQDKSTGKAIGSIEIVSYKEKNEGELEIGYVLNPKFQGKGLMTECLIGMFKFIKQNKIAKRIVLTCNVANPKSSNVMKRAGMTFEGIMRKAGCTNLHSRFDVALYSILDEEIEL